MSRKWPVAAVVVLGLVSVASHRAFGEITQADLRSYTEYALREGHVKSEAPTFSWDDRGVEYNLGGVSSDPRPVTNDPSPRDELLAIPLREQYIVTGIRLHRTSRQQRRFWNPILERVEVEIGKMLLIIVGKDQSRAVLREQLAAAQEQIHTVYFDALNELARKSGGRATDIGCGDLHRPCKKCSADPVALRVEPENGELDYITAGEWSFYQYFKDKAKVQKPSWESLPTGDCVCLYGKNWIRAKWPNDRSWKGLVDIGTAKSVTVTPHGVDLRR